MERKITAESLFVDRPPSAALVRRGMRDLEGELVGQFRESQSESRVLSKASGAVARSVAGGNSSALAASMRAIRVSDQRLGRRKLAPVEGPRETERIFSGSIAATRVPPYSYPWTWSSQNGGASVSVTANQNTGRMGFGLWNAGRAASGSAAAAIGIYFRPVFANGILRLWSNPAFNYQWWTYCVLASAHSDGWIGLYVGRYTLAGGFDGAPVNQRVRLWNDDSWWSGAGSHSGSTSGFPLFAQLGVDSAHWYALWVWCGGRATGDGWGGLFSGSGAGSNLSVLVPSMTWELF